MTLMENRGEIIMYQPDDEVRLEVRLEEDTVRLNRQQLSELFYRDIKTIGKHVNNALKEELATIPVVAKFATTAADGKHYRVKYILKGYSVNQRLNRLERLQQPYQHISA